MDEFLQEQVARGEQQVQQDQRLAHACQENSGPVDECAGDTARFDLDHSGFFLFIRRRTQVVYRHRCLVEAGETREDFLNPLPQLGHVLRRFIHPRPRRAAQLEKANPDGRH